MSYEPPHEETCNVHMQKPWRSEFTWPFLRPYTGTIPNQKKAYIFPILGIIKFKFLKNFPKHKGKVVSQNPK